MTQESLPGNTPTSAVLNDVEFKQVRAVLDGTAFRQMNAVLDGTAFKQARAVLDGTAFRQMNAVLDGTAFRQVRAVLDGTTFRQMNLVLDGTAFKQARAVLDGTAFRQMNAVLDGTTFRQMNLVLDGAAFKQINTVLNTATWRPGDVLGNSRAVGYLLDELESRGVDLKDVGELSDELQTHVMGAAVIALEATCDGRVISPSRKPLPALPTALILVMLGLLLQCILNWNQLRESICDINARLPPTNSISGVRKFVRTQLCGRPASDARIVNGHDVRLRTEPSMKSQVLMQLQKGHVVAVVSREDHRWLLVSFEKDGYVIEGWVSRKYLTRIR